MPYKVYKKGGKYKVCKTDDTSECFSKKPMSKSKAEDQMKAIYASENPKSEQYDTIFDKVMEQISPEERFDPVTTEELREKLADIDSLLELFLVDKPLDPVYPTVNDYRAMLYSKLERYMQDLGKILALDVE
jgi:hypothetical protein